MGALVAASGGVPARFVAVFRRAAMDNDSRRRALAGHPDGLHRTHPGGWASSKRCPGRNRPIAADIWSHVFPGVLAVNIHVIQIYRYDLPLARPLPIGGSRSLANRSGLILELIDDSGSVGLGEIAPLPGSSRETLEEAEQAAIFLAERIRGAEIPLGLETMTSGFEDWIGELGLPPSVRCGFEAAVLGLIALQQGVPLERLLCDEPLRAIAINGLLSGNSRGGLGKRLCARAEKLSGNEAQGRLTATRRRHRPCQESVPRDPARRGPAPWMRTAPGIMIPPSHSRRASKTALSSTSKSLSTTPPNWAPSWKRRISRWLWTRVSSRRRSLSPAPTRGSTPSS